LRAGRRRSVSTSQRRLMPCNDGNQTPRALTGEHTASLSLLLSRSVRPRDGRATCPSHASAPGCTTTKTSLGSRVVLPAEACAPGTGRRCARRHNRHLRPRFLSGTPATARDGHRRVRLHTRTHCRATSCSDACLPAREEGALWHTGEHTPAQTRPCTAAQAPSAPAGSRRARAGVHVRRASQDGGEVAPATVVGAKHQQDHAQRDREAYDHVQLRAKRPALNSCQGCCASARSSKRGAKATVNGFKAVQTDTVWKWQGAWARGEAARGLTRNMTEEERLAQAAAPGAGAGASTTEVSVISPNGFAH